MKHVTLSGTDLQTSQVVLGTMTFGSQVDLGEARNMVHTCLDRGISLFDTANAYNEGRSEEILGQLVKDRREQVLIATKVGNPMGSDPTDAGLNRAAIFEAIDASLERLQTDYVDVYYLHKPDWSTPIEESLEAMDALVRAGKIRYGATSNYAAWQMAEMLWLAERNGWQPLLVSQPMYNLVARRLDDEYAAFSKSCGLSNIAYNPLAGGLLTGKHQPEASPQPGSRFTMENYRERYWNAAQFAAVARLGDLAAEAGLTLVELSFRWLLSRPLVDAVLLGASSLEQLWSNLAACEETALNEELATACDEVWQELRGAAPNYNR
jgi:aryl-alcohol dehydrogenase-like predicted oxidoreductase